MNADISNLLCTGGRHRTHNLRFWRPRLYQLSYTRVLLKNILILKGLQSYDKKTKTTKKILRIYSQDF